MDDFLLTFIGLSKQRLTLKPYPFIHEMTCSIIGNVAAVNPDFAARINHKKLSELLMKACPHVQCGKRIKGGSAISYRRTRMTRKKFKVTLRGTLLFLSSVVVFIQAFLFGRMALEDANLNPLFKVLQDDNRRGKHLVDIAVKEGKLSTWITDPELITKDNMYRLLQAFTGMGKFATETDATKFKDTTKLLFYGATDVLSGILINIGTDAFKKANKKCYPHLAITNEQNEPVPETVPETPTQNKGYFETLTTWVSSKAVSVKETVVEGSVRMSGYVYSVANAGVSQGCVMNTVTETKNEYKRQFRETMRELKMYQVRFRNNVFGLFLLFGGSFKIFLLAMAASKREQLEDGNENVVVTENEIVNRVEERMRLRFEGERQALLRVIEAQSQASSLANPRSIMGAPYNLNQQGASDNQHGGLQNSVPFQLHESGLGAPYNLNHPSPTQSKRKKSNQSGSRKLSRTK
jgi:hypothetical protein